MSGFNTVSASTTGYVGEYRSAFPSVPFTTEKDGVITDVSTGERVELRATDPGYAQRYGALAAQRAVNESLNAGVNPSMPLSGYSVVRLCTEAELRQARDLEMGYVSPDSMFAS